MKPVDQLGFGPKRTAIKTEHGWLVTVTPPAMTGLPANSLTLTDDQYRRYQLWQENKVLMQNALPELSPSNREILITGIGNDDFQKLAYDPPDVPCIDGTENHEWVISDENENICYCARCGCPEY